METIGRYRVLGEAGRGGMGLVLRAVGPDGRLAAIKLLLAGAGANPAARIRFQREAQALQLLHHPHLVRLLETGEARGAPWLALEWVEGETLERRLAREGPLAPPQAVSLVSRLALALAHCHAQGILHRDLKPANVLLRAPDAHPLLTDFGLARDLVDDASQSRLTRTGAFLGSPGFWSPEQALGRLGEIGPRSDVFGLGAILFAALTGRPPFPGATLDELLDALQRPAAPPSVERPGVPTWLDAVCARCLALSPGERFQSAAELAQVLQQGGARAPSRRPVAAAAALLLSSGLLLGLLVVVSWPDRRESATPAASPEASVAPVASDPQALLDQARRAWRRHDLARARELSAALVQAFPARRAEGLLVAAQVMWIQGERQAAEDAANQALACATGEPERLLAEVLVAAARNDAPLSRRISAAALEAAPDDADLAFWAATTVLTDTEAAWDRVLALDPEFVRALYNRGLARNRKGDRAGALADMTRVLQLAPGHARALHDRGTLRRTSGDLAGSLEDFARAIEADPSFAMSWAGRAGTRNRQGDRAGAIQDATRAQALDPGLSFGWQARGEAYLALDRVADALADYERAVEVQPDDPEALGGRGLARFRSGDLAGARADYDRSLALGPGGAQVWYLRGRLRLSQGDAPGAIQDCSRALELAPGDHRARLLRGRALREAGRRAEALRDLTRVSEESPSFEVWFELGFTRKAGGDLAGALNAYARAAETAPRDHQPWIWQGNTRLELRDFARAEADYGRAIELAPRQAEGWDGRGRARLMLGLHAPAIEDLTRAIELAPRGADYYSNRAAVWYSAGDRTRALADLERALELDPRHPNALVQRDRIQAEPR